ncbi:MAG TPA: DUF72 domain-containing protein [Pyrinomonadaceae bacterium]|jgi:uncharacterized protein YecE (DUF72 family)
MPRRARRTIKTGCCGFRQARGEYVRQFDVVEVQQTFYQPPRVETLARWRAEAPPRFEFTLKAWQLITHEARSPTYRRLKRELSEDEREQAGSFRWNEVVLDAWATTRACAEALGATRVLFQCPASFRPVPTNLNNLRRFFKKIERPPGLVCLWEPRGDWPRPLVAELCAELQLVHVVDPFVARTVTPAQCYYRLHGRGGWRYAYEDEELLALLELLPAAGPSYVMFNNVRMREDAARFRALIEGA